MAKFFIKFGLYSKKLLLPFTLAIIQIILNLINIYYPENDKSQLLEMVGGGLSQMIVSLVQYLKIFNYTYLNKKEEKKCTKTNIKDYSLLSFIFFIFLILNVYISIKEKSYSGGNKSLQNFHNMNLFTQESIEMIFLCIVSFLLLKYKYFIHHIISILLFILVSLFMDFITDKFSEFFGEGVVIVVINIVVIFSDALSYGFQKYMIDIKFHPYWNVSLCIGLTKFSIFFAIIIVCLFKSRDDEMFGDFYNYFEKSSVGIIISKHIISLILNVMLNLFKILTIAFLTPDYILISFTLSKIVNVLLETKEYVCIAMFIVQFISLMIYLEIIELNFLGLNKNTRNCIQNREYQERLLERSKTTDSFSIDINGDYYIDDTDNNKERKSKSSSDNGEFNQEMKDIYND